MSAAIAKAQIPARPKWNTLQRLWGSLYLIWSLDAVLFFAVVAGVQVHRDAMKVVGKDTVPSIIAAQHIKSALADMDANAANEFLGEPDKLPEVVAMYDKRRREAATALIDAAKNITYGIAEQNPIEALQIGLGTYEARVQRARDLHEEKGPKEKSSEFADAYRNAASEMDDDLLPQADNLDKANHDVLEQAYSSQSTRSGATVFVLLVVGAVLVGVLVAVQKFLHDRTHRILNPLLLLATLVAMGFLLYTFRTLAEERRDLKVAKEDAFTSIHALWRARAVGYSANGDESRYLLDSTHAQEREANFNAKAASLAKLPDGMTFASVAAALQQGNKVEGFTGYLADELNNITFEGERAAAIETFNDFGEYLRIDRQIRGLEGSKKHAEALELCIGSQTGESNWAFEQFDKALDKTLDINQQAFDNSVAQGFASLSYFELKAFIAALAIGLLAFFGLLQRIQEYR